MKIKTAQLIGVALDWAVAKCEGFKYELYEHNRKKWENGPYRPRHWQPSTDWSQGGPLLNQHKISRTINHSGLWIAYAGYTLNDEQRHMQCDRSELVAGLRCLVALNLGDEVDVPDELVEAKP